MSDTPKMDNHFRGVTKLTLFNYYEKRNTLSVVKPTAQNPIKRSNIDN